MARSTLAELITELRGLTKAGTAEYSLGTVTYWTDDHLQGVLDSNRQDVYRAPLMPVQTYNAGTVEYKNYYTGVEWIEQTTGGTAIFWIEDSVGNNIGTVYTMDYRRGHAVFNANTNGSSLFWNGRNYDLNRAAADVWRQKAAHHAESFDFQTDNHRVNQSAVYKQCLAMADYFEQRAITGGVIDLYRGDT